MSTAIQQWFTYVLINILAITIFITPNRSLHTVIQAVTSRSKNQPNALRSLDLVVEKQGFSDQTSPMAKPPAKLVVEGLRPSDQSVYLPKLPLVNSEESDEPLEF